MIIQIEGLTKSFKDIKAVDDLSFSVREGELFAFLGVNGAGKSTTINIISGILKRDGGSVEVCGRDIDARPREIKGKIGVVFQNSVLDKRLSVYDNLKSRAALYGIYGGAFKTKLGQISQMFELDEILKRPPNKLSGGQRRRADIARALIHDPELLILDEPTTGLDPKTRRMVWEIVEKYRRDRGMAVLLTTHYMEESAIADNVLIIDGGKKAAEGSPHSLKSQYASDYIRFYSGLDMAQSLLAPLGYGLRRKGDFLEVELPDTAEVAMLIQKYPAIFKDFEVLKGNMDNVFLKVTGKDISEVQYGGIK